MRYFLVPGEKLQKLTPGREAKRAFDGSRQKLFLIAIIFIPCTSEVFMRYIIYGAGAIGGSIGARLHQQGKEVILICRGPHLEAILEQGLKIETPGGSWVLAMNAVAHPGDIDFKEGDVVFMTMKSQHTVEALGDLLERAGDEIPLICCQNGVCNEPAAREIFNRVYGMVVILPASHLEPGIVQHEALDIGGILDAGNYPSGVDAVIETVTADLRDANFSANAEPNIMRWKYAKLLNNLRNGVEVVCVDEEDTVELGRTLMREAIASYKAADIDCATRQEVVERRGDLIKMGKIDGRERAGSSSWQSIVRGTGSIEADFLNGEICAIGRRSGIPTPFNQVMQSLANKVAQGSITANSMTVAEIEQLVHGVMKK